MRTPLDPTRVVWGRQPSTCRVRWSGPSDASRRAFVGEKASNPHPDTPAEPRWWARRSRRAKGSRMRRWTRASSLGTLRSSVDGETGGSTKERRTRRTSHRRIVACSIPHPLDERRGRFEAVVYRKRRSTAANQPNPSPRTRAIDQAGRPCRRYRCVRGSSRSLSTFLGRTVHRRVPTACIGTRLGRASWWTKHPFPSTWSGLGMDRRPIDPHASLYGVSLGSCSSLAAEPLCMPTRLGFHQEAPVDVSSSERSCRCVRLRFPVLAAGCIPDRLVGFVLVTSIRRAWFPPFRPS